MSSGNCKHVEIFYFDAGGGHRNAMSALTRQIEVQYPHWNVVPVDLQALLEPIDPVYRLTRALTGSMKRFLKPVVPKLATLEPWQAQDIYNNALKRGVTKGMGAILPVLQRFIARYSFEIEAELSSRWRNARTQKPDLVISVIPNFNWPMFGALRRVYPDVPYVTIITDLVDCPPHFWMEDQNQIMICGVPKAYQQAVASGFYQPENIHLVSGMILKSCFYETPGTEAPTRKTLGLKEDKPTALIMFGGNGSARATNAIIEQLRKARLDLQIIVLCGNNGKLLEELKGVERCAPVGFVSDVASYMRLADFFIGKPGPGSISEALHMGLPVIVEKNENTMPQERPNPDWVVENNVGITIKNFRRDIGAAAGKMLANLPAYQANIKDNLAENRAIYEITDLLGDIVENRQSRPPSSTVTSFNATAEKPALQA